MLVIKILRLKPEQIVMIVHKGEDFPSEIERKLLTYSSSLFTFLTDPHHHITTRALNRYSNTERAFKYLTPKRQISLSDIVNRFPDFVHLICSPARMRGVIEDLHSIRSNTSLPKASLDDDHRVKAWRPQFVYEPVPDSCRPENLEVLLAIAKSIDVFSPNELEARSFLGTSTITQPTRREVEDLGLWFLDHGFRQIVIRCGKMGCLVMDSEDLRRGTWVPAMIKDQAKVIDQTGGGNAFLVCTVLYDDIMIERRSQS